VTVMTAAQSDRTPKLLLTPLGAAEALSISRLHFYVRKHIFSVKLGGARRIPLHALQAYVADLCVRETERAG
jgi:hypothetical protein